MKRYMHEPLLGLIRPCNYGHWVRYEDAKARANMADELAAVVKRIRDTHHVTMHGQIVISRDDVRALEEAAAKHDALKEG